MYTDHHFTVIYLQTCVVCVFLVITSTLFYLYAVLLLCCVSRSSLYCNIPSDLCNLCLSCYYFYIALSLYLYCCYVVYPDHHFTVIYLQNCVVCVCLVITSCFIFMLVLLLCYVSRSSLYCNIPSDLCSLCITSTLFYLYTCTVVMLCIRSSFTVIYLQTCVVCVCLVITSTLFYLYACTVVMLCIQIITLL